MKGLAAMTSSFTAAVKAAVSRADVVHIHAEGPAAKLSIPWLKRKKMIEKVVNAGFPVTYDAYPEWYVGWGPREAFRRKVIEIDGGMMKPIFVIG